MKKVRFERPKKQPLVYWSDRLCRGYLKSRDEFHTTTPQFNVRVIIWHMQLDQDKTRSIVALDITSILDPTSLNSKSLLSTPLGYICPRCKTNEFIHSQLDFYPISFKDAARFNRADYGVYCRCCGTLS